jgi:Flp pilus assembly protein TadD
MEVDSPQMSRGAGRDATAPDTSPPETITELRALLDADPHDLDALGRLGDAQLADHDPDGALVTATIAIELDPERDLPHRQASIACSRRGHHREAIAHAEQAVRLAPVNPRGFTALARALVRAKRDLERARHAAVRAIVIAPGEAESHLVFGIVARAEREDAAAEAAFRRALQLEPGNVSARNELARLTVRRATLAPQGRPQERATSVVAENAVIRVAVPGSDLDRTAPTLLSRLVRRRITAA